MGKQINNVKYAVIGLEIIIMDNYHAMHVESFLEGRLFYSTDRFFIQLIYLQIEIPVIKISFESVNSEKIMILIKHRLIAYITISYKSELKSRLVYKSRNSKSNW